MINKIILNDEMKILKGNFSFVYDITSDEYLYCTCLAGERNVYTNEDACQVALRKAYEGFGRYFQIQREIDENNLSKEAATKKTENSVVYDKNRPLNSTYKNMFIEYALKVNNNQKIHETEYRELVVDYNRCFIPEKGKHTNNIREILYDLYAKLSRPMHYNLHGENDCINLTRLFYKLISILLEHQQEFKTELIPIDEYYPVPSILGNKLNILIDDNTRVYVNDKGKYFLFKKKVDYKNDSILDKTSARELEVLDKLWDEENDNPNNVPLSYGEIGKGKNIFKIYAFPSKPVCLDNVYDNKSFTIRRRNIAFGLIKAIYSLQNRKNPIFLRTLNRKSVFLCEVKDKIKVYIVRFETAKISEYESRFTVKENINEYVKNSYIAPEVRSGQVSEKSDVYSLGKILFDLYSDSNDDYELSIIRNMCSANPENRPDINEIWSLWKSTGRDIDNRLELYANVFTYPYDLQSYHLTDEVEVGRRTDTGIKIPSKIVSRNHGIIYKKGERYYYRDLESTNGTFVNGNFLGRKTLVYEQPISDGTIIRIDRSEHNNPHIEAVVIFICGIDNNSLKTDFIAYYSKPFVINGHILIFRENMEIIVDCNNRGYCLNGQPVNGRHIVHKYDVVSYDKVYVIFLEDGVYVYNYNEEMINVRG